MPAGRRSFCGQGCVDAWREFTDVGLQSRKVLERDRGVCEQCGLDCVALFEELQRLYRDDAVEQMGERARFVPYLETWIVRLPRYSARVEELALPRHLRTLGRRLWEMDHRVPVVEGGGGCGLDNLRTLCWRCHAAETAKLARRRAERRRGLQKLPGVE